MSDEIDVEELLRRGGKREEAPGAARTFGRHLRQGLNPLWDEGAGYIGANMDTFQRLRNTGSFGSVKEWLADYRRNRDESRDTDARGATANPTAATAGSLTGMVAGGIAAGGAGGVGRGLLRSVTSAATQGAAQGLASSEEDLTYQDARAYAQAVGDTLKGGAMGAAGGAVGHGIGAGVRKVGKWAKSALGRARGELLDEASAARAAEDEALQKADIEQQRKMAVRQQDAQRLERVRAREVAREKLAAERAARAQAGGGRRSQPLDADPDTRVLRGHAEGAHKLRADNEEKVLRYREYLKQADLTPERRQEYEGYLSGHSDAVDNPVAFRLKAIEQNLRKKYPAEVVDRLMQRFDARGNAVSRGHAPQPTQQGDLPPPSAPKPSGLELPERTQVPEPADWLKRGHDPMEVVRQGGGGSAWRGDPSTARTVVNELPPPGTPSFSQEEVVARHRNAPQAPSEAWRSWREWETAPQTVVDGTHIPEGYRRLYRSEGVEPGAMTEPVKGHEWFTDRLGVADEGLQHGGRDARVRYLDVPEAEARKMLALNRSAPRFARNASDPGREWAVPDRLARKAEDFPGRQSTEELEDLDGIAADSSGMPHWERGVDGPFLADEQLVETVAGPRPLPPVDEREVTAAMTPWDAVRQGRGPDLVRSGGGGSAMDAFHDARTRAGLIRTSPEGGIRSEYVDGAMHNFEFRDARSGEVYEVVVSESDEAPGVLNFENVFPKSMGAHRALSEAGHAQVKNSVGPGIIRQVYAELARAFPDAKGIQAQRVTGANPRQQMGMRLPEVTRPGAPSFDAPQPASQAPHVEEALPPMEEMTNPGRPLFSPEPGVRPSPLGPLPRGINPYEAKQPPAATVGGRGRPAPAGEGTRNVRGQGARAPAVDEALAMRRAAAAEAQLGGGGASRPEPTKPGRGRPSLAYDPDNSMVAPRDFADLPPEPELPVTRTAPLEGDPTVIRRRPAAAEPESTVAAEVPRIRRQGGAPEPVREVRRDGATRFGPPPLEQRMAARPSVEELARQREQGALGKLAMAGYEGARGANNMLAAPIGAAIGITREALQNPAVRARAISAFKLDRLARVRPEVYGRVGRILAKAMEKGPKRYDATRHVLLLNDADFRQTEAEADEELQGLDDEALSQRLRGAR